MQVQVNHRVKATATPKFTSSVVKVRDSKWNIEVACAELTVDRLPEAWKHPLNGLGGVHTITGREWIIIIVDDLATAYELHCHWAEYAIGAICWWDETLPPPNLCRVLNMRVISNTKYVPAHYYVENEDVLFDREWMAKHCGELFQRMGDPDGEGLMRLCKSPNPIKRKAAECIIERIKQVAHCLGVPYSERLWYKRTTKASNYVQRTLWRGDG